MPTEAQISGPFSYQTITLSGDPGNNYDLVANKTKFDPANGETIQVYLNGTLLAGDGTAGTSSAALTASSDAATFYVDNVTTPTKVHLTTPNHTISSGTVLIKRISNRETAQVDFAPGSVIREQDLDASTNQTLHVAQEAMDIAVASMVLGADDEWDAKNKVIKDVADAVEDNDAVNYGQFSPNIANIGTVAGISADVTTVAGIATDVTAVDDNKVNIDAVAGQITPTNNISAVGTNIGNIALIANDLSDQFSHIDDLGPLDEAVESDSSGTSHITAVATNITNVNTVAGISGNVTTVAGIAGDVTAVKNDAVDIGKVATIDANVTKVANIDANVTKVADIDGDVTKVADIDSNVTTVADNITNVSNFADLYQIDDFSPSAPTTDGGGNAVAAGDLAYDSTANQLKYYNGSGFVAINEGDITSVVAGTGLTGGGTDGDVTVNVVGGTGITANADDIAIDSTVTTLTGSQTLTNKTLTSPTLTTPDLGTPSAMMLDFGSLT